MEKNDWYEAGDQIKKLVQDAVDTKDFSQLSNTITDVVNDTVNGIQSVLKDSLSQGLGAADTRKQKGTFDDVFAGRGTDGDRGAYTNGDAAEQIRRRIQERRRREQARRQMNGDGSQAYQDGGRVYQSEGQAYRSEGQAYQSGSQAYQERQRIRQEQRELRRQERGRDRTARPVKMKVPGEFSGRVMKWLGYSMSGLFGFSLLILLFTGVATGFNPFLPVGILGLFFGANFCIGLSGSKRLNLARRFRRYQAVLGTRTYCLIEELANAVGKSSKFVRKDLKRMIADGFFHQAYLDGRETLLMTDQETYQQYLTAQAEYQKRAPYGGQVSGKQMASVEMEQDSQTQQSAQDPQTIQKGKQAGAAQEKRHGTEGRELSPECRELTAEGKRYIQHIHECNDRIDDEAMSAKLDRLEVVITRIFSEAEKDPGVVDDLKKMMSYYLPTTRKLLDAYCELEEQPVSGQNIASTKKEIENALDTINTAFENLLDSFFEEKAWDISSDISVLNTMFAQEGLTGKDFEMNTK